MALQGVEELEKLCYSLTLHGPHFDDKGRRFSCTSGTELPIDPGLPRRRETGQVVIQSWVVT